jgi:hypothetical protein
MSTRRAPCSATAWRQTASRIVASVAPPRVISPRVTVPAATGWSSMTKTTATANAVVEGVRPSVCWRSTARMLAGGPRVASPTPARADGSAGSRTRCVLPLGPDVSQLAWFSSRCVLSGVRSRPCRAILHPFTRGSSQASADAYLTACSHDSVRAKHGRSSPAALYVSAAPARRLTGNIPGMAAVSGPGSMTGRVAGGLRRLRWVG